MKYRQNISEIFLSQFTWNSLRIIATLNVTVDENFFMFRFLEVGGWCVYIVVQWTRNGCDQFSSCSSAAKSTLQRHADCLGIPLSVRDLNSILNQREEEYFVFGSDRSSLASFFVCQLFSSLDRFSNTKDCCGDLAQGRPKNK